MSDVGEFAEMLGRIRSGDERAAAELVRAYEPLVRREIRFSIRDPRLMRAVDSMDVCQSVLAGFFVGVALGEYDLEDPRQLLKLLVTMARNKVASAARREQRAKRDYRRLQTKDSAVLGEVAGADPTASRVLGGQELLARFRAALSPEELRIADLRSDGVEWSAIAVQLGGTAQSRRMQFARAIRRLAGQLGLDEGAHG